MVLKAILGAGLALGAGAAALGINEGMRKEAAQKRADRIAEIEALGLKPDRPLKLEDFEDPRTKYYFDTAEEAHAEFERLNDLGIQTHLSILEAEKAASALTIFETELSKYGDKDEAIIRCAGTLGDTVSMLITCVPHTHGKSDSISLDDVAEAFFDSSIRSNNHVAKIIEESFDETMTWPVTPGDRLRFKVRFTSQMLVPDFDFREDRETGLYMVFRRKGDYGYRGHFSKQRFGEQEKRLTVPFFADSKPEAAEQDVVEAFFDQLKAKLDEVIKEEDVYAMAEQTIGEYIDGLEKNGREVSRDLRAELIRVGQKLLEQRSKGKGPWAQ